MVGLFAGLNALGIGWKQFQWLAALITDKRATTGDCPYIVSGFI